MGIINALEEKVLNYLEKGAAVDACMPDEETEEQQRQRKTDIKKTLEEMRRHAEIMADRS